MRDDFERNEVERSNPDFQRTSWIASSLLLHRSDAALSLSPSYAAQSASTG
jgi:hypothetical protein